MDDGPMCETGTFSRNAEDAGPPPMTLARKQELLGLAASIAATVEAETGNDREKNYLRRALEMLINER